jgi:hypothetical protein
MGGTNRRNNLISRSTFEQITDRPSLQRSPNVLIIKGCQDNNLNPRIALMNFASGNYAIATVGSQY